MGVSGGGWVPLSYILINVKIATHFLSVRYLFVTFMKYCIVIHSNRHHSNIPHTADGFRLISVTNSYHLLLSRELLLLFVLIFEFISI